MAVAQLTKDSIFKDKRDNEYKIITCARDIQTGEIIVVYSQEWGEKEILCCPRDAFMISMSPMETKPDDSEVTKQAAPMTGHERMLAFLDADEFEEKSVILKEMYIHEELTNSIIDNLAAALDVVIDEGSLQTRYDQLRICVDTRARYESLRLR